MLRVTYCAAPSSKLAVGGPASPADVLSIQSESTSNDRAWLIILEILSYIDHTFSVYARDGYGSFGEPGAPVAFELLKHNGVRSLAKWEHGRSMCTIYSTRNLGWWGLASRNDPIGVTYRDGNVKLVLVQVSFAIWPKRR